MSERSSTYPTRIMHSHSLSRLWIDIIRPKGLYNYFHLFLFSQTYTHKKVREAKEKEGKVASIPVGMVGPPSKERPTSVAKLGGNLTSNFPLCWFRSSCLLFAYHLRRCSKRLKVWRAWALFAKSIDFFFFWFFKLPTLSLSQSWNYSERIVQTDPFFFFTRDIQRERQRREGKQGDRPREGGGLRVRE